MSVIATITVYQCNGCDTVAVCRSDAEYRLFELSWYEGLKVDFCHACRGKSENADRILADNALRQQVVESVARLNGQEEKTEYAH